jgi:hypothetical protein
MKLSKNILVIALLSLSLQVIPEAKSQNWLPMDKGLDCFYHGVGKKLLVDSLNGKLYISGMFNHDGNCTPLRGISAWNGNQWDSVGSTTEGSAIKAAMTFYNNSLYLYGIFYNINTDQYLAKWNGLFWDTLPKGPNNTVSCFLEKDGILYIGGGMDHLGNDSTFLLGKYDGNQFSAMTPYRGPQGGNAITTMAFFQDTLYVGGNFHMLPYKNLSDFAKWDGFDLQVASSDFANTGALSLIESMVVYQGELYVGGYFRKVDGYAGDYIMKWDGHNFTEVGNGVNERVTCMKVYNNQLYVGGSFTQAGAINSNYIAKWNGTTWNSITTDTFTGSYPMILDLNFYKDSLIIAGSFTAINGDTNMQRVAKYSQPLAGIKTVTKGSNDLTIYPNPATNQLTIEFTSSDTKAVSFTIKNILGETVKIIPAHTLIKGSNKVEMDINEFSNGIYFVQVINESNIYSAKLIKQ